MTARPELTVSAAAGRLPSRRSRFLGVIMACLVVMGTAMACDNTPRPAPSSPASNGHQFVPKVGTVDSATNGLEDDQVDRATDLASWLTDWTDLDFEYQDGDDLRELAESYEDTKLGAKRVPKALRDAARLIEKGQSAADKRSYQTALNRYAEAAKTLKKVPDLVRADVKKAERTSGTRLRNDSEGWSSSDDRLFPLTVDTEEVIVEQWVDGDTVETSSGKVRLIGIDTPEMKDACSRAQAAKEAAASLAPPGSTILLGNPDSVQDTDKYERLLRYVDVPHDDSSNDDLVVDVGYSLLLSGLAVTRYDSRDGYQWHPRQHLYRAAATDKVESDKCHRNREKTAFVLAAALGRHKDSDEYHRKRTLGKVLNAPYKSATRNLPKDVASIRELHQDQDRLDRQESSSSSGSSGGGGGYTGPRCYAPGGKTWKPC